MKRINWKVLSIMMVINGLTMVLWTAKAEITAQASSTKTYGYVFKSKRTAKRYGKKGNPKTVYFATKSAPSNPKMIGLRHSSIRWIYTNGHHQFSQKTFYVPRTAVKRVNTVVSQRKLKKTAYRLEGNKHNFWDHPYGTRHQTGQYYLGEDYEFQTLYVIGEMKTRFHGTYDQVVTKKGKKLGWIYHKALVKGNYQDPVAYLTEHTNLVKRVWVNPRQPRIKVATLSDQQRLKTIIVQNENDTAIVINVNADSINLDTYYLLKHNRSRTALKTVVLDKHVYSSNFYRYSSLDSGQVRVISLMYLYTDASQDAFINIRSSGIFTVDM